MTPNQQPQQSQQPTSRLARRLGMMDAVVVGLGAMIGAGIFASFAPAAGAAGNWLLPALGIAAVVSYCNATSSAQLAAMYPESGGTYVYGRKRLGPYWGFVAGWLFVIGKIASCAAMAATFAGYAAPSRPRLTAVALVFCLTVVNLLGVQKTVLLTRAIVAVVLGTLALTVGAIWGGGATDLGRLWPLTTVAPFAVLRSAGFLFFAFAGYARLATLGEEVVDPARTIPRAVPIALGITWAVYAIVATTALAGAGAAALASSGAPLATAVELGGLRPVSSVVRVGAAVGAAGVLVSLIVGVSRTVFAMAANRDLPRWLAAVHPRTNVPHRAEIAVGVVVSALVAVADLRSVIGFSSFAVLLYYAIANASAWTLPPEVRRWPRPVALAGLVGCGALALTLPPGAIAVGVGLVLVATVLYCARRRP